MGKYYARARLVGSEPMATDVRVMDYELDEPFTCRPGQYFMLWLPGSGEIPLSPSVCDGRRAQFVIEAVGPTSSAILSQELGEECFLRGPFGRSFSLDRVGPFLLAGGGTGAAPLLMAARELAETNKTGHALIGARSADRLCYVREFTELATIATFATEDGSFGVRGRVSDYVESMIKDDHTSVVLTAGPELMMKEVVAISERLGAYSEASLVRIIKCADGACGACVLDPGGQLVCKDGPVIAGADLLNSDFGSKMRDSSGRRVEVR